MNKELADEARKEFDELFEQRDKLQASLDKLDQTYRKVKEKAESEGWTPQLTALKRQTLNEISIQSTQLNKILKQTGELS